MFSLKAADKMKEVFDTLFKTDEKRKDALENPVPTVKALIPNTIKLGQPANISIEGDGFTHGSTIELDGLACTSEFQSAQQLLMKVAADRFQEAGSVKLVVKNPPPGGGASPPTVLTINP
jgi:IPT/TIG domain